MKAVFITGRGRPERTLRVREAPRPPVGPEEVLIRVRAAGINFADCLARQGLYPGAPRPPFIPGLEVAGKVVEVGEQVEDLEVGQPVMALCEFGGHAELVATPARAAVRIPSGLSYRVAAALPVNYLTAYFALFETGPLRAGDRVLIHAAAGGVGTAAIQLARTAEVEVYGTVGSDRKVEAIRELGVTEPINYRLEDWRERVRDLTGGDGVDLILDSLGPRSVRKGLSLLRPGGRIVSIGGAALTGRGRLRALRGVLTGGRISPLRLLSSSRGIYGLMLPLLARRPKNLARAYGVIVPLAEAGTLAPVIDSTYPLEEAWRAHERLESRESIGKLVLEVG